MIIKWPGGKKNTVNRDLHYNLDLCPTMCDLLDVMPGGKWDGESFADTILREEQSGREYLVLSQQAHVAQRSVRFKEWLYIRTYHDGFHLFPKEMLFDLAADPYEQYDLAQEKADVCGQAARILLEWHDRMMLSSDSQIDPLWTVLKEGGPFHACANVSLRDYLKRLEATGRCEGAAKLREKYPDIGT